MLGFILVLGHDFWCLFQLDRLMHFSRLNYILVPDRLLTVFGYILLISILISLSSLVYFGAFGYLYTSLNPYFHLVHLLSALIYLLF